MDKINVFSYLFVTIAVVAKIIESTFITSHYFYSHYLSITLIFIIVSPILGVIFGSYANKGISKKLGIILNITCFFLFAPLAILNFWIINFGK